jgi:hypothetical protein
MKGKKHHSKKASGGRTHMKISGNPDVFKEAAERKHGGKVHKMHGGHPAHRLDRPGRKTGGRVGADKSPLSSANRVTSPAKDGDTAGGSPD